ncbi:hypothetical protein VTL71DRAFT_12436 [Oculimacula yallundae]|uniref:Uncharacterized protein n=1 Tax=Oculimacula yallundae TaxID=86028 RepID=A0ABR4CMJ8_9HELO
MHYSTLLLSSLSLITTSTSSALPLEARQSTTWQYTCKPDYAAPSDFKAFNVGGCAAQLSFTKDRYIGVQWNFDAVYADGSRVKHDPLRSSENFGVGDALYPFKGNNFIEKFPGKSAFTSVHEFTNVCKSGATGDAPVSWVFYTTTANSACSAANFKFTTASIPVYNNGAVVTRPAKPASYSSKRVNDAGDFKVTWSEVPDAAAYSVIVEYPTNTDDVGRAVKNVRGARVLKGALDTTVPTGTLRQGDPRSVIVHTVDSKGLWSLTTDAKIVGGMW